MDRMNDLRAKFRLFKSKSLRRYFDLDARQQNGHCARPSDYRRPSRLEGMQGLWRDRD